MSEVMLWNKDKTESVKASKIRSFGVYGVFSPDRGYKVLGWFNSNESFYFGNWDTIEDAHKYLEGLHARIEGRE